ncbi:hypothetical protein V8E36_000452 [Tilletia maclaganii]
MRGARSSGPAHGRYSQTGQCQDQDIGGSIAAFARSKARALSPGQSLSMGPQYAAGSSSKHAAASIMAKLAARRDTMTAIPFAQPVSNKGKAKSVSSSSSSSSSSAPAKPITANEAVPFQDGITLIMDRRLLGKPIGAAKYSKLFKEITDVNRLNIKPVISKKYDEAQVQRVIYEAFARQGHNLLMNGQKGDEFSGLVKNDHNIQTLAPPSTADNRRSLSRGSPLPSSKCSIIVDAALSWLGPTSSLRNTMTFF